MNNLQNQIDIKEIETYVLWHQFIDAIEKETKSKLLAKYEKSLKELEELEKEFSKQ